MSKTAVMGIKEIAKILPHRYPFLLVDKIVHMDLEKDQIIGQKNLTMNEAFFQGHFPGAPIMPGVLVLEALAQAGGILAHKKGGFQDKIAVFLTVNNAKFRSPIRPGDILFLHVESTLFSAKGGKVKGRATIDSPDGKLAVEADLGYALVDRETI